MKNRKTKRKGVGERERREGRERGEREKNRNVLEKEGKRMKGMRRKENAGRRSGKQTDRDSSEKWRTTTRRRNGTGRDAKMTGLMSFYIQVTMLITTAIQATILFGLKLLVMDQA